MKESWNMFIILNWNNGSCITNKMHFFLSENNIVFSSNSLWLKKKSSKFDRNTTLNIYAILYISVF